MSFSRSSGLPLDQLEESCTQIPRRDDKLSVRSLSRESGKCVEQIGEIGADLRVACEQSDIRVESRCFRVVVAGADMRVACYPVRFAPHYQGRLRVRL